MPNISKITELYYSIIKRKQIHSQYGIEDKDMADYVLNNESFEFTYSAKQQEEIEHIRNKYLSIQENKNNSEKKLIYYRFIKRKQKQKN